MEMRRHVRPDRKKIIKFGISHVRYTYEHTYSLLLLARNFLRPHN